MQKQAAQVQEKLEQVSEERRELELQGVSSGQLLEQKRQLEEQTRQLEEQKQEITRRDASVSSFMQQLQGRASAQAAEEQRIRQLGESLLEKEEAFKKTYGSFETIDARGKVKKRRVVEVPLSEDETTSLRMAPNVATSATLIETPDAATSLPRVPNVAASATLAGTPPDSATSQDWLRYSQRLKNPLSPRSRRQVLNSIEDGQEETGEDVIDDYNYGETGDHESCHSSSSGSLD